jgi:hypothetical protein
MYYDVKQIMKSLNLSQSCVYDRINKLGLKGQKVLNKNFYTEDQVLCIKLDIQEFEIPKVIYHTQTFHIYQSKMNYE